MADTNDIRRKTRDTACREQVEALNNQAWDLRAADTQQAIALSEQARAAAERCNYRRGLARSLFISGHCHYRIADYELARSRSLVALALFETLGDHEGRADALNTIGNVHSSLGDHHSALDFYKCWITSLVTLSNTRHLRSRSGSASPGPMQLSVWLSKMLGQG